MGRALDPSHRERERMRAVRRYAVLDTPPDGAFDRIAALAARFFAVPMATVSIVDHDRIWFKAAYGVDISETERAPGLCASAILQPDPYVLTDARHDPRALDNPLVRADPGVRFYAAAPIRTGDGHNLGTVSVLGFEPREVTDDEIATLRDLADIAIDELEMRLAVRRTVELERAHARQHAAVAALGSMAMDSDDPRRVGHVARDKAIELLGPDVGVELVWDTDADDVRASDGFSVPIGRVGALMVTGPGAKELPDVDHEFLRSLAHVVNATVQQHQVATELVHLATHDALTGLPNRRLLLDRLEQVRATSERTGERFAVLFFDLDGFKAVNDGLGHEAGDEVLRGVADRLRGVVRPTDSVARFGGDEFAVLCPDVRDEHTATLVAERVRTALATEFTTRKGSVAVTASIGVAFGDQTTDGSELLRDVDSAMYAAKAAGRNRVEVFSPDP